MKNVFTNKNLSKDCIVCNRPFNWRKKWEKVWDDVKYCSEKCKRNRRQMKKPGSAVKQEAIHATPG